MSLDDALFLVDRAGTNYRCKGSDIGDRMVDGDSVLVQRNGQRFKATYDGSEWSTIQDSDLLLAWDGTKNRSVTGANFKTLFKEPDPWLDVKLVYVETLCDRGDIRFTTTGIPNGYFDYPDSPTGLARIKSYIDDWYLDGVNQGRMDYIASPTLYIANVDTAPTGAEVVGGVRLQLVAVQPNGMDALPIRQRIELSAPVINTCTPI